MPPHLKPTHTMPGAYVEEIEDDDLVVNDSFGTVDIADSSGVEEDLETGEAKIGNFNTRED